VSHDRAFLENTVTQIIAFEGNGVLTEFGGGYDDWSRFTQQKIADEKTSLQKQNAASPQVNIHAPSGANKSDVEKSAKPKKLSFKEEKELENLPELISALENEQAKILASLSDGEVYRKSPEDAKAMQLRLNDIETEIARLLKRWEELETNSA
jgi:ATP-binding cassette subfamily F protein uup